MESCVKCVSKHLGAAIVFSEEIGLGMTDFDHVLRLIGHLACCELESVSRWPGFAQAVRKERNDFLELFSNSFTENDMIDFVQDIDFPSLAERFQRDILNETGTCVPTRKENA